MSHLHEKKAEAPVFNSELQPDQIRRGAAVGGNKGRIIFMMPGNNREHALFRYRFFAE